jgi:hypothetical protein
MATRVSPALSFVFDGTITPTGLPTSALTSVQTFTVYGLLPEMKLSIHMPDLEGNVVLCNAYCSAANTLSIRFHNVTAATIAPAQQAISIVGL